MTKIIENFLVNGFGKILVTFWFLRTMYLEHFLPGRAMRQKISMTCNDLSNPVVEVRDQIKDFGGFD